MSKLTDGEILKIASTPCAVVGSYVHTFARAIEAAATEPLLQRIAELEEMNAQLREQNTEVGKTCAELEAANEAFAQRQEWWNERMVELERQLEEARNKALEEAAKVCNQSDEDGEGPDCWDWHAKDFAAAIRALKGVKE